jgi:hypothetical protein
MTTTINGLKLSYGISADGESLIVTVPDQIHEGETYTERYPWTGGCWTDGTQTTGTCDVRAPRHPSKHRAFVRRIYAECV